MAEIRRHIRALVRRHELMERLDARPDIMALAGHVVAVQNARLEGRASPAGPALPPALPRAEELATHLNAHAEFDPVEKEVGLAVPGGTRHALLNWSPILQLALLETCDGNVAGRRIDPLPSDLPSLLCWLEVSLGFRQHAVPDAPVAATGHAARQAELAAGHERAELDNVRDAFEKRFGFALEAYARWMFDFRSRDPVLYVLLLSREYRLALRHRPELGQWPKEHPVPAVPGLVLPPIVAAMTIGELQRLVALYRDLVANSRTTTADIRAEIGDKARSKPGRGRAMAAQIRRGTGRGHVYDHAPLRADAVRKLFLVPRARLKRVERHSFLAALFAGEIDWDHARSAESRHGAHMLLAATLAPEIYKKRTRGKGQGYFAEPLGLYYGVPVDYLVHLGITELGLMFTGTVDRASSVTLAHRIMKIVSNEDLLEPGEDPAHSGAHERRHKQAMSALNLYLLHFPRPGSAGRFAPMAWLHPGRDAPLFRHLLEPVRSGDRRLGFGGKRGKFYLALWFLQMLMPKLYCHIRDRRLGVRIICDLATSASVLTSEPILHSLLLKAGAFATPARRKPDEPEKPPNRGFKRGARPSTTQEAIQAEIERALRRRNEA